MDKQFLEKQKLHLLADKEKIMAQLDVLKSTDPFTDPDHATDNASPDTDAREEMGQRGDGICRPGCERLGSLIGDHAHPAALGKQA